MSETMQGNDIQSLRATLFSTLRALGDKQNPMEIGRAKAICDVSQTIINSVKAEIDFANATGQDINSEFIPSNGYKLKTNVTNTQPGVFVHKLR